MGSGDVLNTILNATSCWFLQDKIILPVHADVLGEQQLLPRRD